MAFLITVLEPVRIRLADGRIFSQGQSVTLEDEEIDANIQALDAQGIISVAPPLPTDPESLARFATDFDKDPIFPFIEGRIANVEEASEERAKALHAPVADITALRAIASSGLEDRMIILVEDVARSGFRFDAQATETDNGSGIIKPDDIMPANPGRWFMYTGIGAQTLSISTE